MARLRLQGVPESAVAEQVADVLRRVSLPQVRLRPFTRAAHVALPLTAPCAPRVPRAHAPTPCAARGTCKPRVCVHGPRPGRQGGGREGWIGFG